MEIERKFLVDVLPEDLESCPVQRLEQAYLSTQPVTVCAGRETIYTDLQGSQGCCPARNMSCR